MAGSTQSVRHIRLLALGSQGDVAPYVALGLRLQQAGKVSTSSERRLFREQQREQRAFLQLLWQTTLELVEGADLLLYSFSALFAAPHVAEKLGIPALLAACQPALTPTRAFPANSAPALPLGGWYNRFTYTFFEHLTWLFLHQELNSWRCETLHLAPVDVKGLFAPLHQ